MAIALFRVGVSALSLRLGVGDLRSSTSRCSGDASPCWYELMDSRSSSPPLSEGSDSGGNGVLLRVRVPADTSKQVSAVSILLLASTRLIPVCAGSAPALCAELAAAVAEPASASGAEQASDSE